MREQRLFICEEPATESAIQVFRCPICLRYTLISEDPCENNWVALGEAVCSKECHEKAYELMREKQHAIPLYHQPP